MSGLDPILAVPLGGLLAALGAWIQSKVEKKKASLRPPVPRECVRGDCHLPAMWCEYHGRKHSAHFHDLSDPPPPRVKIIDRDSRLVRDEDHTTPPRGTTKKRKMPPWEDP